MEAPEGRRRLGIFGLEVGQRVAEIIGYWMEDGNDALADWMGERAKQDALLLDEAPDPIHVQTAMLCYGPNLTEADLIKIGKDPFLVAAALVDPANRQVVTAGGSKPGRTGSHRHLPNVCADCAVTSINLVQLMTALNFTTGWKAP